MLDATITYSLSSTVDVTEHPVEDGADIGDHAQKKPKLLTVRAIVTESPFDWQDSVGGLSRVQRALEFFDSIAGTLVTVVTQAFGSMSSMAVTRYPTTRDTLQKLEFDLEFKQVRVATASSVSIAPDAPRSKSAAATLPDAQDVGEQPTTAADANMAREVARTSSTKAAADKSYLLSLSEAFGGS